MKNIFILLSICLVLFSCSSSKNNNTTESDNQSKSKKNSVDPVDQTEWNKLKTSLINKDYDYFSKNWQYFKKPYSDSVKNLVFTYLPELFADYQAELVGDFVKMYRIEDYDVNKRLDSAKIVEEQVEQNLADSIDAEYKKIKDEEYKDISAMMQLAYDDGARYSSYMNGKGRNKIADHLYYEGFHRGITTLSNGNLAEVFTKKTCVGDCKDQFYIVKIFLYYSFGYSDFYYEVDYHFVYPKWSYENKRWKYRAQKYGYILYE